MPVGYVIREHRSRLTSYPTNIREVVGLEDIWIIQTSDFVTSLSQFTFDLLSESDSIVVAIRATVELYDKSRCIAELENFLGGSPSCISELVYWDSESGSIYNFSWQLGQESSRLTHWYPEEFMLRFSEAHFIVECPPKFDSL